MADGGINVAAELALLRGEMTTGLAKIEGQLNLLVQSQGQVRSDLDDLDRRVSSLESRRLPLPALAAVSGTVSAAVAVVAILVR